MADKLYLNPDSPHRALAKVVGARTTENLTALTVDRSPLYPGGGGQRPDEGWVIDAKGRSWRVAGYEKHKGDTLVLLCFCAVKHFYRGDAIHIEVDGARRFDQSRCHTASHLVMSRLYRALHGLYETISVENDEDGRGFAIELRTDMVPASALEWTFDDAAERIVMDCAVTAFTAPDLETARLQEPELFRVNSGLTFRSGKVRMVRIERTDLNPCGGTHLHSLGQIGGLELAKSHYSAGALHLHVRVF